MYVSTACLTLNPIAPLWVPIIIVLWGRHSTVCWAKAFCIIYSLFVPSWQFRIDACYNNCPPLPEADGQVTFTTHRTPRRAEEEGCGVNCWGFKVVDVAVERQAEGCQASVGDASLACRADRFACWCCCRFFFCYICFMSSWLVWCLSVVCFKAKCFSLLGGVLFTNHYQNTQTDSFVHWNGDAEKRVFSKSGSLDRTDTFFRMCLHRMYSCVQKQLDGIKWFCAITIDFIKQIILTSDAF